jgi:predicted transcriptional regulator
MEGMIMVEPLSDAEMKDAAAVGKATLAAARKLRLRPDAASRAVMHSCIVVAGMLLDEHHALHSHGEL